MESVPARDGSQECHERDDRAKHAKRGSIRSFLGAAFELLMLRNLGLVHVWPPIHSMSILREKSGSGVV
jgi:hypothetical protein